MSGKNKKQFGVWMDTHVATIVGRTNVDSGDFIVMGHATNEGPGNNSSEYAANNLEQSLTTKFFKEITSHMQNIDELHLTGTGTIQEQFKKYMAETPQYKNARVVDTTSNKMSNEKLIEFIEEQFH